MANIKVIFEENTIQLASKFAKKAANPLTKEYSELQKVKALYSDYRIVVKTIKRNPQKECYKGLTYNYMRDYIATHEEDELAVLAYFDDLLFRSRCHSKAYRYPVIKAWFLNRYPEVKMNDIDLEDDYEENDGIAA